MLPRSVIAVPRSSRAAIVSNKRKIGRWRSKAHVLDETFRVNSAFNAELFVTPPHPVAMEFNLFGERRSGHWVKGGGVSKRNFWLDSASPLPLGEFGWGRERLNCTSACPTPSV